MAHFAKLDNKNKVISVEVVVNEVITDSDGVEQEQLGIDFLTQIHGGFWMQTSYNGIFRKNYAGTGYQYNSKKDAFIPPKPYPSWILDENTCNWVAPIEMPDDGKIYRWDEGTANGSRTGFPWKEIEE